MAKSTKGSDLIQKEWKVLQRAKNNPQHFGVIYEQYFKEIYLFIFKRLNDQELTKDLTQQVFVKAIQHLPKYEFKGFPFSSFLYRVAINEINLHFRYSKKIRSISIDDNSIKNLKLSEAEEENYEWKLEMLIDCVNDLSEGEVELLELRFFEQRSYKEIAYILNVTENNAKVKAYRLLEKMRKKIAK